ncbi:MAG: DUF1778 domain-containing protein [Deltaproteobacteria bacterium]|nr:MAG: DUF1778 domain-containing protein [Deltaproteobacteria bacterium]
MERKTEQLQIRVTRAQKRMIRRLAAAAGMDVSSYVLSRALPAKKRRWQELIERLAAGDEERYVLAALNDLLAELGPEEFGETVAGTDVRALPKRLQNQVAAMTERAAERLGAERPAWTAEVSPLERPYFASTLPGLRLYLLRASPVVFRRRNLFVDASVGDRI